MSTGDAGGHRETVLARCHRLLQWALCVVVFAIMALTTADVFARYFFAAPIRGAYEIVSWLLAVSVFLALPTVIWRQENIAIDLLPKMLSGGAARAHGLVVRVIEAAVAGFVAFLLWTQAGQLAQARQVTGFLEWPIAPLAYVLSALALLAALAGARLVVTIFRRRAPPREEENTI